MIFDILWGILEIIQFILSDKHLDGGGQSLRHFLDKVKECHFNSTSNEFICPPKNSNSMHGSKSAICAIFQTGPGWLCTVSSALKNPSQDFINSFFLWVQMNSWKCWKAKLEWPHFFKVQSGKITVLHPLFHHKYSTERQQTWSFSRPTHKVLLLT